MYEVQILTATRAEYGLLRPLIFRFMEEHDVHVSTVVTGMHLSDEFGMTYRQIEEDGVEIAAKIPILLGADTPCAVSKAMGLAMIGFADFFARQKPDCLVVLGDRFETLAVCCAAFNERIPIIHLHGGERSEGAMDEAYRHAITKLSHLHFASTEEYRRRIIQLGEAPERVFNVGALGVENALRLPLLAKAELEQFLDFSLQQPYAVVTFHPATLEEDAAQRQCQELLDAMEACSELRYLCTKANADAGGRTINRMLAQYAAGHPNVLLVDSLGALRYLTAVKYAALVLGNSSSGLLEVPSFGIPTVNIGDRQKGRIQAESVINCTPERESIETAIRRALDPEMRVQAQRVKNPYQGQDTSRTIVSQVKRMILEGWCPAKEFFDVGAFPVYSSGKDGMV